MSQNTYKHLYLFLLHFIHFIHKTIHKNAKNPPPKKHFLKMDFPQHPIFSAAQLELDLKPFIFGIKLPNLFNFYW